MSKFKSIIEKEMSEFIDEATQPVPNAPATGNPPITTPGQSAAGTLQYDPKTVSEYLKILANDTTGNYIKQTSPVINASKDPKAIALWTKFLEVLKTPAGQAQVATAQTAAPATGSTQPPATSTKLTV